MVREKQEKKCRSGKKKRNVVKHREYIQGGLNICIS